MMWQVTITSLNAETLGEIRIRHDRPIDKADIVIIHAGGDHYMGCGKYAGLIICSAGLMSCSAGLIPQVCRYDFRRFNTEIRRFNMYSRRLNSADTQKYLPL